MYLIGMPKLKFINAVYLVENTSWNRNLIGNLQEFQYGKETVQTTTNNLGYRKGKFTKVRDRASIKCNSMRNVCKLFGYGNIEW